MNKAISIVISLILPMIIFQIAKVLAVGIGRMNSASAITYGLRMVGFGNPQTGILVMMLLSLATYIVANLIIENKA